MTRSGRLDYKEAANAKITARLKQMVVLFLTIILGVVVSVSVNA